MVSCMLRAGGALRVSQEEGRDPMLLQLTRLLLAAAALIAQLIILILVIR